MLLVLQIALSFPEMVTISSFRKITVQIRSYKNHMEKQAYGSVQQNRALRNKLTHLWSINLWQRKPEYTVGKRQSFSKWCWESWTDTHQSLKLEYTFTPHTKINSKWLPVLDIRHDIIKLLGKNIGKTFSDINCTNIFLGQSPKAREIWAKIDK